jgi:hypothetical protein
VKLVINVEIWNIVAHIAFKFYPDASGTFSTASTPAVSGRSTSTASVWSVALRCWAAMPETRARSTQRHAPSYSTYFVPAPMRSSHGES